jgi:CPA2 family monovalent cation:H+ antiporter-2
MLLDPAFLWHHLGLVMALVIAVAIAKAAILGGTVRLFGYRRIIPLAVGLTLFQVGEFAFVMARIGQSTGAIGDEIYALTLNTAVATMALTPIVSSATPWLYARIRSRRPEDAAASLNLPESELTGHVVITGAGRVGRTVADTLTRAGVPCVIVELDQRRVEQARSAGFAVIYGDATQEVVLKATGFARAKAVAVTVPTYADVRAIVSALRRHRPDIPIVARAESADAIQALAAIQVDEIVSPEFEAAIEMARRALAQVGTAPVTIADAAMQVRRERYKA